MFGLAGQWRWLVAGGMAALAVRALLLPERFAADIALLASVLAAILLLCMWRAGERIEFGWIERGSLYVSAALLVHHLHRQLAGPGETWQFWPLLAPVAAGVALRFWGDRDRRFSVTPLDLLVVFGALVVPNLPGSVFGAQVSAATLVQLIVLFYAIECLGTAGRAGRRALLVAAAALNLALAWLPAA
jgi:hypothetical protein